MGRGICMQYRATVYFVVLLARPESKRGERGIISIRALTLAALALLYVKHSLFIHILFAVAAFSCCAF